MAAVSVRSLLLASLPHNCSDWTALHTFEEEEMKQKTLKTAMGFGAVSTLLVALFGGDLVWSYWQGVQGLARDSLRDATSITFDLQRLCLLYTSDAADE